MKMRKIYFTLVLSLFCLIFVFNRSLSGDEGDQDHEVYESDELILKEVLPDSMDLYSPCEKPPAGATPVTSTILPITLNTNEGMYDIIIPDSPDKEKEETKNISVYYRQIIETGEEYIQIFGEPSDTIDWKNQRILVYEQTNCYKFNDLGYTSYLSGVYAYEDTIYIGTTTTHYGPCQGIHQDMSWFSFDTQIIFILLPRLPEKITYYYCTIGGCPPDIP